MLPMGQVRRDGELTPGFSCGEALVTWPRAVSGARCGCKADWSSPGEDGEEEEVTAVGTQGQKSLLLEWGTARCSDAIFRRRSSRERKGDFTGTEGDRCWRGVRGRVLCPTGGAELRRRQRWFAVMEEKAV